MTGRIVILILFILFSHPQTSESQSHLPTLPRTSDELKTMLERGFARFSVPANSGLYDLTFDSPERVFLPIGLRITFLPDTDPTDDDNQTEVLIGNAEFHGNNDYSIEFMIHHPVKFTIRDSRFMNTGRLWFRHGYRHEMFTDRQESAILVERNYIENVNYRQEPYFSAVLFQRFMGMDVIPPIPVELRNITFIDNHIVVKRDAEAADYRDDYFYIRRTFTSGLHFSRTTNRDYVNHIRVERNIIEANNAPGFDTPVWAFNFENRGFSGTENTNYLHDDLIEKNTDFRFNNNVLKTQSKYQSGAFFFMGPFSGLEFKNNVVEGFTRYQIHNCPEPDESQCGNFRWGTEPRPVVVFYGARITQNVNNIHNLVAESNIIRTGTSGYRINGVVNGIFRYNTVYMDDEIELPPFYNNRNYVPISDRSAIKVSSGHAWEAKYKSRNILIDSNTVYGNNHDNVAGIRLFFGSDLTVTNNRIHDITSFGIQHESSVAWADEATVGRIEISGNYITANRPFSGMATNRRLYFGYLTSYEHLELDRHVPPAMISFSRLVPESRIGQIRNEQVLIRENTIRKFDTDTLPVYFDNGVIRENGAHVRFADYDPALLNGYNNEYILGPNFFNEFINKGVWTHSSLPDQGWVTGDFNGDGFTDLLRPVLPGRGAAVWFGGGISFMDLSAGIWTSDPNFGHWYTGRFTRTDRDEIMSFETGNNGTGTLRIYSPEYLPVENRWFFRKTIEFELPTPVDGRWYTGDFNGDGFTDLLAALTNEGGARVFLNDGTGHFHYDGIWLDTEYRHFGEWYIGDFNGNGYTDLLGKTGPDGGARVFPVIPTYGRFGAPVFINDAGMADHWIIGDFNGDGRSDMLRPAFTSDSGEHFPARIWFGRNMLLQSGESESDDLLPLYEQDAWTDGQVWTRKEFIGPVYTGNFINNGRSDLLTTIDGNTGAIVFANNSIEAAPNPYIGGNLPEGVTDEHRNTDPDESFTLLQNYPNPFNPVTNIIFQIPGDGNVQLTLYTVAGQRVMTLMDQNLYSGMHGTVFDGSSLSSGVYLLNLRFGNRSMTRKIMILR